MIVMEMKHPRRIRSPYRFRHYVRQPPAQKKAHKGA
jgi:hypothetical protein